MIEVTFVATVINEVSHKIGWGRQNFIYNFDENLGNGHLKY